MQRTQEPPESQGSKSEIYERPHTRHAFSFTGSALEYFSIWIVHTALTVVTLGLYSPWAKVRRERYLVSHTVLAGTQFEYTADPWKIFKGRVLLLGIAVGMAVIRAIPKLGVLVLFPLTVLVWPWVLVSALRFRARYTAYRNVSFHFLGSPIEALTQCILPKVAIVITLWLLAPWAQSLTKRYTVNNLQYGATPFRTPVKTVQLYAAYLRGALLFLAGGLVALLGFCILGIDISWEEPTAHHPNTTLPVLVIGVLVASCGFGLIVCARSYIRLSVAKCVWNGATIGSYVVSWNPSMKRYLGIEIVSVIVRAVTLGLASPWCVVMVRRFLIGELALVGPQAIDEFLGERLAEVHSLGDQAADAYQLDMDFGF